MLDAHRGSAKHPIMEDQFNDDEEAEGGDLDHKACNDDGLGHVPICTRLNEHERNCRGLSGEGKNISGDKDPGQPLDGNDAVTVCFDRADDSPDCHVDSGSKEGNREQNETPLQDVWHELVGTGVGGNSDGIAIDFPFGDVSQLGSYCH